MPLQITIIFALILANGFFAAAEMALVAARRTRLQGMADDGDTLASEVITIQEKPSEFLAAVQIGITLVGTLASAFGGAELTEVLAPWVATVPALEPYAETIALTSVVIMISYTSLVFGELVPKRLALRNPESLARLVVQPLNFLSRLAFVPMRLLSLSAEAILRLLGSRTDDRPSTTPEEIEILIAQAAAEGVIEREEQELIDGVFAYGDRHVWDVMTPRTDIVAIEVDSTPEEALITARKNGFSRYPVTENNLDNIIGYVHVKDIIWAQEGINLRKYLREVVYLPGGMSLPGAFSTLTRAGRHMAVVLDEYGGTDGLLTLEDLLEVIVGEIEDEHSPMGELQIEQSSSGWVYDGATPIDEVEDALKIEINSQGQYVTLGGFMMTELGAIPRVNDQVVHQGYRFSVLAMERLRVSRVEIAPYHLEQADEEPPTQERSEDEHDQVDSSTTHSASAA